ncbi:MAG: response regulator [Lewinellaceae bacterium]|nr:response regulator [Lewinellaceae bacterium]
MEYFSNKTLRACLELAPFSIVMKHCILTGLREKFFPNMGKDRPFLMGINAITKFQLELVWRPGLIAKRVNFWLNRLVPYTKCREGVFLKSVPIGAVKKSNEVSAKKWPLQLKKWPPNRLLDVLCALVIARAGRAALLAAFLLSFGMVSAQSNYQFEKLGVNEGLPHSDVLDIVQGPYGFIWIATTNGLCRYDGFNLVTYRHSNSEIYSLSGNRTLSLCFTADSLMLVGTEGCGLNIYRTEDDNFKPYKHAPDQDNTISSNVVFEIFQSESGQIWLGTDHGFDELILEGGNVSFKNIVFGDLVVKQISEIDPNVLWLATNQGIYEYDIRSGQYKVLFPDLIFTVVLRLNESEVLLGSYSGLFLWNGKELKLVNSSPVLSMAKDSENNLWVGTNGEGLLKMKIPSFQSIRFESNKSNPASLSHNELHSLYLDRSGMLWIGTLGGGVNKLNLRAKKFELYQNAPWQENSISSDQVITFYEDENRLLWIGLRGGGINVLDRKTSKMRHLNQSEDDRLHKANVSSFFKDRNGRLWIGTWHGLYILDQNDQVTILNGKTIEYEVLLPGISVEKIIEDYDGHLWLSTTNGLVEYVPGAGGFYKGDFVHYYHDKFNPNTLSDNFIRDIYAEPEPIDGAKVIWVGTRNGLNRMSFRRSGVMITRIFHDPADRTSLPGNFISVIHRDHKGNLWISALGGGLCKMLKGRNGKVKTKFQWINNESGLLNRDVETLLEDDQGRFWLGGHGITRFDPENNEWKYYDVSDGLQSNSFKVWSAYKNAKGEMIFGGTDGFNIFHPDSIADNPVVPKLVFTGFKVSNHELKAGRKFRGRKLLDKNIVVTRKITLPYSMNNISIHFSALHFTSPAKNQYRFKLEGADNNWSLSSGVSAYSNYTYLKPGDYRFIVYASNNDNVWNKEPIQLDIKILPPLWRTTSAYVFYVFVFLGLLYLYKEFSIIQANEKNKLVLERIKRKQIEEVNDIKLQFFTNVSHELRTPLSLISAPIEELKESKGLSAQAAEKINLIYNNLIRITRIVDEILDFRKFDKQNMKLEAAEGDVIRFIKEVSLFFNELAGKKSINYTFQSDNPEVFLWFDRDQLEKVLFNLLSNAFKYTPEGGTVSISCTLGPGQEQLIVTVFNSGPEIPEEDVGHLFDRFYQSRTLKSKGTGIGLSIARSVIEQHKGGIWVENIAGNGVQFSFSLLLGRDHLSDEDIIEGFKNSEDISIYQKSAQINDGAPIETEAADHKNPFRLLVVEDNTELRNYLVNSLQRIYKVDQASNGEEAYSQALADPPDLILSDVMMPKMDGIALCSKLKSNAVTSHIPVILLTARTSLMHKISSFETGADEYITKPFSYKLLLARIENLLESRENLKQLFRSKLSLEPSAVTVTSLDEKLLKRCIDVVEQYMDDSELNVEKMCHEIGLSRPQLYRKLKSLTGLSINQFIRTIRLKRAAQLLSQDNSSIKEIMFQVGFSNSSYFTRAFKEEFNCTPTEYGDRSPLESKSSSDKGI